MARKADQPTSSIATESKKALTRGAFSPAEDTKLVEYMSVHGTKFKWSLVPGKAGLNRGGKSCRLRWYNYLRPDLKRGPFSEEETNLILIRHEAIGNKWSKIAQELPGRTDNDIKNYWNTQLVRRLREKGLDPATHQPVPFQVEGHGETTPSKAALECRRPKIRKEVEGAGRRTEKAEAVPGPGAVGTSTTSGLRVRIQSSEGTQKQTVWRSLALCRRQKGKEARGQAGAEAASSENESSTNECRIVDAIDVRRSVQPASPQTISG